MGQRLAHLRPDRFGGEPSGLTIMRSALDTAARHLTAVPPASAVMSADVAATLAEMKDHG